MAVHYGTDEDRYVSAARLHMQNLENVLQRDRRDRTDDAHDAWDSAGPK